MMEPVLATSALTVGYKTAQHTAVVSGDITLSLPYGEFVCLLGPNGAGKSTLLRTLAGQQNALSGKVFLQGEDLSKLSREALARLISVVLTERITTSLLTVYDLVCMGRLPYTGWSGGLSSEDHVIAAEALRFAGAEPLAQKRLSDLSDGERQRCMLARALAQTPTVLILDEITAFLDLPRRMEMMHKLQQLAHERGLLVILSTHDLDLALGYADRVLLQPAGGKLLDAGPEDLVLSGAFEDAFASEGLLFNKLSGTFQRPRTRRGTVYVQAQGAERYWAERACERAGFQCVAAGTEAESILTRDAGLWRLNRSGTQSTHTHLQDVVRSLASSPLQ